MYKRNCNICNKEITYKNEISYNRAVNNNTPCLSCCIKMRKQSKFKRNCPMCNREIFYSTEEKMNIANKNKTKCQGCAQINVSSKKKFKRNCPMCNKEVSYTTEKMALKNKNEPCQGCRQKEINKNPKNNKFKRNCPICNKEILYRNENTLNKANQNNSFCSSCTNKYKISNEITNEKRSKSLSGENNGMHNTNLFNIWLDKFGEEKAKILYENYRKKYIGENNKMFNTNLYNIWEEKYGREIAQINENQRRSKLSDSHTKLINNDKPIGIGRGWSGWYNNIHFRSMNELNYIIYLFDNNIKFISAESKEFRIKYIIDNVQKHYLPDFYLIEEDKIIEIKPKRMTQYDKKTIKKIEYAKKKYGEKYILITDDKIDKISKSRLRELYNLKQIVIEDRYIDRFENHVEINKERELNDNRYK